MTVQFLSNFKMIESPRELRGPAIRQLNPNFNHPIPLQDGLAELILDAEKWRVYFTTLRLLGYKF